MLTGPRQRIRRSRSLSRRPRQLSPGFEYARDSHPTVEQFPLTRRPGTSSREYYGWPGRGLHRDAHARDRPVRPRWRAYKDFYRWGSIWTGAATKETHRGRLRHLAYAGGWKKFEPLWDLAIRSHRVVHALPLLEAVLTGFGRHHSPHEVALEGPHAPRRSPAGPASGTPEEQHRSKIDISAF